MDVSVRLHAPAALHTGKEPLLPIVQKTVWDPDKVSQLLPWLEPPIIQTIAQLYTTELSRLLQVRGFVLLLYLGFTVHPVIHQSNLPSVGYFAPAITWTWTLLHGRTHDTKRVTLLGPAPCFNNTMTDPSSIQVFENYLHNFSVCVTFRTIHKWWSV
jgi:hypothetical protein